MTAKATHLLTLTLILSCLTAPPSSGNEVLDGVALLKVEAGARPGGMGGAFTSLNDDPRSGSYNPAGATCGEGYAVALEHTVYWENIRFESGWFTSRIFPKWYLHAGIRFAAVDDIEARVIASSEPTDLFDAHDVSLKSGLSYEVSPRLSVGFSLGLVYEKIEAFRGSALSLDLGVQAEPADDLRVGAAILQLGNDLTLSAPDRGDSDAIPLPATYRVGASYAHDRYLGAADVVIVDDQAHLHVGVEGRLHSAFHLRTGYMFGYDSKGAAAGASFVKGRLTVDYAFVPYSNELGTAHVFNVTLGF